MVDIRTLLPPGRIAEFCRTWKVTELSVFGSVLREDFRPDSDVDFLIAFAGDAEWSLFDHARMELELEAMIGRRVQVLTRRCVEASENPIRRREILRTARSIYRAA